MYRKHHMVFDHNIPVAFPGSKEAIRLIRKGKTGIYLFPVYKCLSCGEFIHLEKWQLEHLPVSMAKCKNKYSQHKIGFWEWIFDDVNTIEENNATI